MAIGKAIQKGTLIYIYDETGRQQTAISAAGCAPHDGLQDYTPDAVHVRKGALIYAYNEKGRLLSRTPVNETYTAAA